MGKTEQLHLFETPKTEVDYLWEKYVELKEAQDKTRRKMFGELGEMKAEMLELKADNARLKARSLPLMVRLSA